LQRLQLIVVTNCSSIKTATATSALSARSLPKSSVAALLRAWRSRRDTVRRRVQAGDLYAGRSFRLVREATDDTSATLWVISAGMGLIPADRRIPAYRLTIAPGARDSVLARAPRSPSTQEWWRGIRDRRPGASPLRRLLLRHSSALIILCLTQPYLLMIADELVALDPVLLRRVRLVCARPTKPLSPEVNLCIMPYDSRIDDPSVRPRGTASDFAARALVHFLRLIRRDRRFVGAQEHARRVRLSLASRHFTRPQRRKPVNDRALLRIVAGLRRRMSRPAGLRHLRSQMGYACESNRFAVAWSRT